MESEGGNVKVEEQLSYSRMTLARSSNLLSQQRRLSAILSGHRLEIEIKYERAFCIGPD
jgi:hypothetical protein